MDPTVQWEDASDIMNTKTNCDAFSLFRKQPAAVTVEVLLAETEKEACYFNKPLIRFTSGDLRVSVSPPC